MRSDKLELLEITSTEFVKFSTVFVRLSRIFIFLSHSLYKKYKERRTILGEMPVSRSGRFGVKVVYLYHERLESNSEFRSYKV